MRLEKGKLNYLGKTIKNLSIRENKTMKKKKLKTRDYS